MIVDRVRTTSTPQTFPGGLVALRFLGKQKPVQMFFVEDTSVFDEDPQAVATSAVKVNFTHSIETLLTTPRLSLSFDIT